MVDCPSSIGWEVARTALPSLVVIIGWYIANRFQRASSANQATRNERSAAISRLERTLHKLRDLAIEYHTDTTKGAAVALQIKVAIDDILRQVSLLSINFRINQVDKDETIDCISQISDAVTGGDFETSQRTAWSSSDPRLISLFNNSAKVLLIFEREFLRNYRQQK